MSGFSQYRVWCILCKLEDIRFTKNKANQQQKVRVESERDAGVVLYGTCMGLGSW